MGMFDDLIAQQQEGAAQPPQGLFDDLIAKHQNQPSQTDMPGPIDAAAGAAAGLGQGLINSFLSASQRTETIIQGMKSGASNYQLAPDAEQAFFSETGFPRDQTKQVVLISPDTGKPAVFNRAEATNVSPLKSAALGVGRALAFGAVAPSDLPISSIGRSVTTAVTNRLGSDDTKALAQVGRAVQRDIGAGGPSGRELAQSLIEAGDTPLTLADVGGENVKALAGQVARIPGPGRQQISQFLNDRDALAGGRLAEAVNAGLGEGEEGNFTIAQNLMQQRAAKAAPLYEKAYAAPPPSPEAIAPDATLGKLMGRPSMKQAMGRAVGIASEEGRDPMALGINPNAPGLPNDPFFAHAPSWQTLDYVKRGLDDVLEGYRDTTTGRLNLDEAGRAINTTRADFLKQLDRLNPDLAAARQAWAGESQSIGALKQGASLLSKAPDEIAAEIARLSPAEKQFYQLGAANAVKAQLARTSSGGNEARAIIGNIYRQKQLQPLFDNPTAFQRFIQRAQQENSMFGTRQAVLGGSQTAARLAQDSEGGGGFLGPVGEAVTAFATHEPILAAKALSRAATGVYNKLSGMTPEVASKIGETLLTPGGAAAGGLQKAIEQAAPSAAPVRPMTPLVQEGLRAGYEGVPTPQSPPVDQAAVAVMKLGAGEPVTRRMLMDAIGSKSMDQVVGVRSELLRRGLIAQENGNYRRARTANQEQAFAKPVPAPAPAPEMAAPQLVTGLPHPLRDQAYSAVKQGAPTLRGPSFDELVRQTDGRPAPLFPAPETGVLDQLGSGHANYSTMHLLKRTRAVSPEDWRVLTSKAENWADQYGVPKEIEPSLRREEGIARAYNAYTLGEHKLPPGLRRIMGGITTVAERASG